MDLIKALEEKTFWGYDFLTWLWFRTENEGGELVLDNIGTVALWIDDMLVMESLESESKENILKTGDVSRSAEAAAALTVGKKVTRARFGLVKGDAQWSFTIDGATFDIQGMKIPKVEVEEDDDPTEGTVLLRLSYINECLDIIDTLFKEYSEMRTDGRFESEELPSITHWITQKRGN